MPSQWVVVIFAASGGGSVDAADAAPTGATTAPAASAAVVALIQPLRTIPALVPSILVAS
ncbi:hypothetical protein GCM10009809_09760 [Isoptericola hypogeus]|uniref:Secreted peptide n=1 Tax=Isoptericola hypogeus TaxID=300179 RepID=A0ABN2J1H4_9MICO